MTKLGLIYLKFICTWLSFIFTTPTGFLFTNASETKMPGPGEGGEGTWVNFYWICAAGLPEPLPHCSLFCGQLLTPSWSLLGKYVIFAIPT